MQITLTDIGPPIWFLGEPKNIIASLSFAKPGPIEIDFDSLDRSNQGRILKAMQNGYIESDVPFQDLYQVYTKSDPPTPPQVVKQQDVEPAKDPIKEQRAKLEADRKEKEEKFQDKCQRALAGSAEAVKGFLLGEDDPRFFRTLLKMEEVGKARKGVIKLLRERIRKVEDKLARQITREANMQETVIKEREEKLTKGLCVVESEQRTIVLTPEDLIAAGVNRSKT
jgi:hypothetical protein